MALLFFFLVFSVLVLAALTESSQYMDKRVTVALNGSRKVTGNLRGYDVSLLLAYTIHCMVSTNHRI